MQSAPPDLYMNMQQFSELKLSARQHSRDASKAAAQQFEGLFVQMMLKNMRAAAVVDPSQHSSNMDFYMDMHDKQMALMMSQQGGIGIAGLIEKQLNRFLPEGQESAADPGNELPVFQMPEIPARKLPLAEMNYVPANPAVSTHELDATVATTDASIATSSLQGEILEPFTGWDNANSFVADLWPHAEQAAQRLGVSASVLVAQSALETGWGQHAMKKPDGSIAFNLFGIKANHGWQGQSVNQQTLEFRNGAMQRESAQFRAYDSVAEAMDDYVDFVQSNPRYARALQHAGSDRHYIENLHRGGYATDPDYADKIINIMQQPTLNNALAALDVNQPRLS